ncbi:UAA transporter [Paxillus ammoniavirescens]|nr:UAA transporter [Paxillus ammoniavirescens]
MSFIRLGLCVTGVYAMFLLWAIAQERLSVPFQSIDGQSTDKFKSALFIGTCQSFLSSLSALCYIYMRRKSGSSLSSLLGLNLPTSSTTTNGSPKANGSSNTKVFVNGHAQSSKSQQPSSTDASLHRKCLLLGYIQCSTFITLAAPFGFAALSYITYPTMVLGKSCKLVPVMLMNVLLYRRKFAPHKYLVVALVTTGISVFMFFGNEKPSKASSNGNAESQSSYAQLIGIAYLLINLILDGVVNSTQDEIFSKYKVSGQQMMFWINAFCTALSTALGTLPLPYIPVLHPSSGAQSEFVSALAFIKSHPSIIGPLVQFSLTGALGQLFIFETLQHFGSLTLVTITLTRKMFTMILSVVVYNHKLTPGQWLGAAIVFAGISTEALVKRKDVHAKRVFQEQEKAKIKSL